MLAVFTTTIDFSGLRTQISNTTVVVSSVEHDQVEEGTDLECPPDTEIVVLVLSASGTFASTINVPCQLGCRESQSRVSYRHKRSRSTYRIGIHSKYACVRISTSLQMTS